MYLNKRRMRLFWDQPMPPQKYWLITGKPGYGRNFYLVQAATKEEAEDMARRDHLVQAQDYEISVEEFELPTGNAVRFIGGYRE